MSFFTPGSFKIPSYFRGYHNEIMAQRKDFGVQQTWAESHPRTMLISFFKDFLFMRTIFKVFTEFVITLFLFYILVFGLEAHGI